MDFFNVMVIDDEPLARELLETYILNIRKMRLVGSCSNAIEAFSVINENEVDLIFLDINMPELSGLDLIKSLKDPPQVVLTTAYAEYAVQSYELNILDYLLKPITLERFMKSVNKFLQLAQSGSTKVRETNSNKLSLKDEEIIFVKSNGKIIKIDIKTILFIEGLKNYLMIWTESGKIIVHNTMKSFAEKLLTYPIFLRVNKSYIVNIKFISEIDGNMIRIKDERIMIGVTYREEVIKLFNGNFL
jgi:DNA-binding LytR/AlgR family response regulator